MAGERERMGADGSSREPPLVRDAPPIPGLAFRRFLGGEDLQAFVDVYAASMPADGNPWVLTVEELRSQYEHMPNADLDRDVVVVEHRDQVVGFSQQNWVEELDCIAFRHQQYLVPGWRGRGIRRAMLRHCEARAREVAATLDTCKGLQMSTWLCMGERGWMTRLEDEGHFPARYFHEMVRDLREPMDGHPLPEGLEVRPVPVEDHRRVFFAANEATMDHWAAREWTEEDFLSFMENPVTDPGLWVVAYDGDRVAGTVLNWVHREENRLMGRRRGYTEVVTVRRPYRGRGLAKALLTRSMEMLREMGMDEASLGVDTRNRSGALDLYSGLGYRVVGSFVIYRKDL